MKHYKLTILLFVISIGSRAQNLVPNFSFEYSDTCSSGSLPNIIFPEPWFREYGTVDYLHPCKSLVSSSPSNTFGFQMPYSGEGYIGCYNFVVPYLYREYASVALEDTLIAGNKYRIEFNVSLSDSSWYATKNIGIYFSEDTVASNLDTLLTKEPQIEYTGTNYLTDRENWTKIEAIYTALGGERYITIGNFDDDINTDTVFVPGGGYSDQTNQIIGKPLIII